ncbi:MAG TPA: hypothetical protein PKO41_03470 [Dokdonella sp.]|uniref:hypothetical protein n=1 Tax=Dokdonella sp. TaxID=2291710 RepID=UPI0025BB835D|nr:hypothetical protein [Dokdonella sp.]MBX3692258.1 hypothetical protein [Dokdonella sp.]MCW5567108.1 hypothetical protein [Dokdonella sp.]HNR91466.1 hypothetical protein [Dokdonella sp.]
MFRSLKIGLFALACLAAPTAMAVPKYFIVGDLDDPRCQFATIAQALQAALANGPGLDYVMVANNATHANQALPAAATTRRAAAEKRPASPSRSIPTRTSTPTPRRAAAA